MSVQELEAMTRYTSPVNPAVFPHLTVVLLAIGMFFTAWFFVYPSLFTDLHFVIRKVLDSLSHTQRSLTLSQIWSNIHEVHARSVQRAADFSGGVALHGLRRSVPLTVGRHLCLKVSVFTLFSCVITLYFLWDKKM